MSKAEKTPKRGTRIAWILLYNVGFVLSVLAGVEYGSLVQNKRAGEEPQAFLFDSDPLRRPSLEVLQTGSTGMTSYLDPHLGYAHDPEIYGRLDALGKMPGFAVYGDPGAKNPIRIVTLGGSTTDPTDPGNWPKQLQEILSAEGVPAEVYNGGVSGYSTNQELLKLIRDVLPLKPDVIISLSGVNDMGFMHSVRGHPMVHPYQQRFLQAAAGDRPFVFLPNTRRALQRWRRGNTARLERVMGVNYGPAVGATPASQWAHNTRLMHVIAESSDIRYLSILQPTLGVGEYTAGAEDAALMKEAASKVGAGYSVVVDDFYENAIPLAREMDFVVDMTDLFAGRSGLYRNARHPNAEGYGLIAKGIRDELRSRNFLQRSSSPTGTRNP